VNPTPDGWLPAIALWVAMLHGASRTVDEYDEIPANEPLTQRAAGWMTTLSGLPVIALVGAVCVRDWTAVLWPETRALVLEAETRICRRRFQPGSPARGASGRATRFASIRNNRRRSNRAAARLRNVLKSCLSF